MAHCARCGKWMRFSASKGLCVKCFALDWWNFGIKFGGERREAPETTEEKKDAVFPEPVIQPKKQTSDETFAPEHVSEPGIPHRRRRKTGSAPAGSQPEEDADPSASAKNAGSMTTGEKDDPSEAEELPKTRRRRRTGNPETEPAAGIEQKVSANTDMLLFSEKKKRYARIAEILAAYIRKEQEDLREAETRRKRLAEEQEKQEWLLWKIKEDEKRESLHQKAQADLLLTQKARSADSQRHEAEEEHAEEESRRILQAKRALFLVAANVIDCHLQTQKAEILEKLHICEAVKEKNEENKIKQAEEQRLLEEKRQAEEQRLLKEKQHAEEEARRQEEQKKAEERRRIAEEMKRKWEEGLKWEEEKKQGKLREQEERKKAEQKRKEEERRKREELLQWQQEQQKKQEEERQRRREEEERRKAEAEAQKAEENRIGRMVRHEKYGRGVIVSAADTNISVIFDNNEMHTFALSTAAQFLKGDDPKTQQFLESKSITVSKPTAIRDQDVRKVPAPVLSYHDYHGKDSAFLVNCPVCSRKLAEKRTSVPVFQRDGSFYGLYTANLMQCPFCRTMYVTSDFLKLMTKVVNENRTIDRYLHFQPQNAEYHGVSKGEFLYTQFMDAGERNLFAEEAKKYGQPISVNWKAVSSKFMDEKSENGSLANTLNDQSFLAEMGYSTNRGDTERQQILDKAVRTYGKNRVISMLDFFIDMRVNQRHGEQTFARALRIWRQDTKFVRNNF